MTGVIEIVFLAIIFVISISLHEYAHARTSYKLGDPTPKIQGRLTPNPLVHIDPIGLLMIFIIHFGRGRPVQVDPSYYKNPLRDELLVALAGPATNLLLAIGGIIIGQLYILLIGVDQLGSGTDLIMSFWTLFAWINVALAVFNMIPLPPLDGYRVVMYLWPKVGFWLRRHQRPIAIVLLAAILLPGSSQLIGGMISSVAQDIYGVIYFAVAQLFALFY